MRCSICGKEFGEGINCQNCGVDRVTGLANYSSYGTSDYQGTNTSHYDSSYYSSPKTMVCFACGEIIPSDSEYCPYCRKKLYVKCPKCGNTYSSQFPACNKCGTNRNQYLKAEKEREQIKAKEQARLERLQRQQQQKAIKESKENFRGSFTFLGYLGLFSGVLFIIVAISEHGSENFRINQGKELLCYIFAIACLIIGLVGISNKKP